MVTANLAIENLIEQAVEVQAQAEQRQKEIEAAQRIHTITSGSPVLRQALNGIGDELFDELAIEFVPDDRSSHCACGLKAVFSYEQVQFTIFYESDYSRRGNAKQVRLVAEMNEVVDGTSLKSMVTTQTLNEIDQNLLLLFIHKAGVEAAKFIQDADKRAAKTRLEAVLNLGRHQAFAAGDEDSYTPGMTLHQYYVGVATAAMLTSYTENPAEIATQAIAQANVLIEALLDSKLPR